MKLLTWNIRHGGGGRLSEIVCEVRRHADADFIVLTEFRNNKNAKTIQTTLREIGLLFQYVPNVGAKVNTILVASKHKVDFREFPQLEENAHRVVMMKFGTAIIIGAYFPQKEEKAKVFSFLSDLINRVSIAERIIVAGDLNTGLHFKDEKGKSFHRSEDFQRLLDAGMIDAWRKLNQNVSEYSWFSNSGNGFRIDHCLVSANSEHLIRNCKYIHEPREKKLSDHSQMIIEIDLELQLSC